MMICLDPYSILEEERDRLRAELAQAREETIRSNGLVAIEKAARERAEARVKKLEDMMIEASGGVDGKIDALVLGVNPTGIEARIRAEGRAILARAKEGEKR